MYFIMFFSLGFQSRLPTLLRILDCFWLPPFFFLRILTKPSLFHPFKRFLLPIPAQCCSFPASLAVVCSSPRLVSLPAPRLFGVWFLSSLLTVHRPQSPGSRRASMHICSPDFSFKLQTHVSSLGSPFFIGLNSQCVCLESNPLTSLSKWLFSSVPCSLHSTNVQRLSSSSDCTYPRHTLVRSAWWIDLCTFLCFRDG